VTDPLRVARATTVLAVALAACVAGCVASAPAKRGPGYAYYVTGDIADVERATRGLWVLQGGGDDVDANYVRMGEFGGGGDFVVLRASGEDQYNDYIFGLCHCDSVETIVFDDRAAASDPFVLETIRKAEALFIAGGDQSRYVRFWKDSPVEDAIHAVAGKPAPVGGTSAGMAILGEYVYSAEGKDSLTSAVALADPYAPDATLARGFLSLPGLENVLTDQHLQERDRIGRTVALLARLQQDGWSAAPRAIAADRETALHVDPASGVAQVFATADHPTPFVYFLEMSDPPKRCARGESLTGGPVEAYRVGPGGGFDLKEWRGSNGIGYRLEALEGQLISSREAIY
jgi:cyanophycinase